VQIEQIALDQMPVHDVARRRDADQQQAGSYHPIFRAVNAAFKPAVKS